MVMAHSKVPMVGNVRKMMMIVEVVVLMQAPMVAKPNHMKITMLTMTVTITMMMTMALTMRMLMTMALTITMMMMMMMMMMMIMMIMMMIMMMVEGLKWAFKGSKTEILTSKKRLKDGNGDFILRGLFSRNWGNF